MAYYLKIFDQQVHDFGYGDWNYFTINKDGTFLFHEARPVLSTEDEWFIPYEISENLVFGTGNSFGNEPLELPDNFDHSIALFSFTKVNSILTKEDWKEKSLIIIESKK